jgi:hypothetical protein
VNEQRDQNSKQNQSPSIKQLSAEQVVLLAGLFGFIVFGWFICLLLLPLISDRSPGIVPQLLIAARATSTPEFQLPPTWTPTPSREPNPTSTGTVVYDGAIPTRIYTPRPTSLAGLPWFNLPPSEMALDLARIMQGESPGDKEAAFMVGWVAKNRLLHPSYGQSYAIVSSGFFGYRADLQPNEEFIQLAHRVIRSREDPTGGCLYALSRTDITKLNIHPTRADVAYGEWFFFHIWPLTDRG